MFIQESMFKCCVVRSQLHPVLMSSFFTKEIVIRRILLGIITRVKLYQTSRFNCKINKASFRCSQSSMEACVRQNIDDGAYN